MRKKGTDWEDASKWYDSIVGKSGHHYHQTVILPNALRILNLKPGDRVLDLGCGQGILARHIPKDIEYLGIDASKSLIDSAKSYDKQKNHRFFVGDVSKKLPISKDERFSHAVLMLCLQNIEHPEEVFRNLAPHLLPKGHLLIILNHPCFRIPRHSSWAVKEASKTQYRTIDCYMTPQKIPIQTHPGKRSSEASDNTWSFHHPLSSYFSWLHKSGFSVEELEEWCSLKKSEGSKASMEDRARKEFPLFLAMYACLS